MSLLKRLFGGSGGNDAVAQPETYEGFRIFPEPMKESGGYRLAARVEKDFGDETRTHNIVRADVIASQEEAVKMSISKAKQLIDQQGDRLFS